MLLFKLVEDYLESDINIEELREELRKDFENLDEEFYEYIKRDETNIFNNCIQKTFYSYKVNYNCVFAILFKLKLQKDYLNSEEEREELREELIRISDYLQYLANIKEEERINNYFKKVNDLQKRMQNIFNLALRAKTNDLLESIEEYVEEFENLDLKEFDVDVDNDLEECK